MSEVPIQDVAEEMVDYILEDVAQNIQNIEQETNKAVVILNKILSYLIGPNYLDDRVKDWPLLDPWTPVFISIFYLLSIPVGTYLMRNRQPFKAKGLAVVHNLMLFSLSLFMAIETVRQSYINFDWGNNFSIDTLLSPRVEPGPKFSESGYLLARVCYIHYVSKAYEFVDTWIMILKKNNRQVSFLHVYHHATTFYPVWWAVVRYGPGGGAWLCCALNSTIHVMMYGYYFCASLGLKAAAMKPVVTSSQMIQFCIFLTQVSYLLYNNVYSPMVQPILLGVQSTIFLALFTQFFINTYILKKGSKKKSS